MIVQWVLVLLVAEAGVGVDANRRDVRISIVGVSVVGVSVIGVGVVTVIITVIISCIGRLSRISHALAIKNV